MKLFNMLSFAVIVILLQIYERLAAYLKMTDIHFHAPVFQSVLVYAVLPSAGFVEHGLSRSRRWSLRRYGRANVLFFCENGRRCDDKARDEGDAGAVTTRWLFPPLAPTSEGVSNKITISADEWRGNAIKGSGKPFRLMRSDTLFIIYGVRPLDDDNHKTVGLTCVFCHQLSTLTLKRYSFHLAVSRDAQCGARKNDSKCTYT